MKLQASLSAAKHFILLLLQSNMSVHVRWVWREELLRY